MRALALHPLDHGAVGRVCTEARPSVPKDSNRDVVTTVLFENRPKRR